MNLRPALLLLLTLMTFAGACKSDMYVAGHEFPTHLGSTKAPHATIYSLWEWRSGREHCRENVRLDEGEPIGFESTGSEGLVGFAGSRRFPLEEGRYEWRRPRTTSDRVWAAVTAPLCLLMIPM